jgi:hypothetical protein
MVVTSGAESRWFEPSRAYQKIKGSESFLSPFLLSKMAVPHSIPHNLTEIQVKSLSVDRIIFRAHNPKVTGSNPVPATILK